MRKFKSISIVMLVGCVISIGVVAQPEINVQILPPKPTPQNLISIQISGTWGNSCVPGNPQVSIENHHITIATSHPSEVCLMVLMPFELKVDIGKLPPGTYEVTVTYGVNYPREIGTTGFKVVKIEHSGIFPNPVTSDTTILRIKSEYGNVTLHIFDLAGKKVFEHNYPRSDAVVNLSNLDNGLYLYVLIIQKGGGTSKSKVRKLLIQR